MIKIVFQNPRVRNNIAISKNAKNFSLNTGQSNWSDKRGNDKRGDDKRGDDKRGGGRDQNRRRNRDRPGVGDGRRGGDRNGGIAPPVRASFPKYGEPYLEQLNGGTPSARLRECSSNFPYPLWYLWHDSSIGRGRWARLGVSRGAFTRW